MIGLRTIILEEKDVVGGRWMNEKKSKYRTGVLLFRQNLWVGFTQQE